MILWFYLFLNHIDLVTQTNKMDEVFIWKNTNVHPLPPFLIKFIKSQTSVFKLVPKDMLPLLTRFRWTAPIPKKCYKKLIDTLNVLLPRCTLEMDSISYFHVGYFYSTTFLSCDWFKNIFCWNRLGLAAFASLILESKLIVCHSHMYTKYYLLWTIDTNNNF